MPETTRRVHELKCWPEYFQPTIMGDKLFEVRIDDRGFEYGDILHLREYSPHEGTYTGRDAYFKISYVINLSDPTVSRMYLDSAALINLPHPLVVLGIKPAPAAAVMETKNE
jgi:hypothetical protein